MIGLDQVGIVARIRSLCIVPDVVRITIDFSGVQTDR